MNKEDSFKITSNDYMDIMIKYNRNMNVLKPYEKYSVHIINEGFAVIYIPMVEIDAHTLIEFGYDAIPNYYVLTNQQSLEASGVNQLRSIPKVNLRGKGVIIGIIDTGIDYTNPVFQHQDGTTKIIAIWDQTINSEEDSPIAIYPSYYGTEYTADEINKALKNSAPFEIVPSRDDNGHGTKLAGIAAGTENNENNFSGVSPDADLLVVKIKPAKDSFKELYMIPKDKLCYQENDIIWAMDYLLYTARMMGRPLSICIGMGTTLGAHDGTGNLNVVATLAGDTPRVAVSIAAGNEGSSKSHFYSELDPAAGPVPVELNIGDNEYGFTMELWGDPPVIYSLDILSPSGEYKPIISERLIETQTIRFIFDQTIILINYVLIEQNNGKQVIILRFKKPTAGIWRFRVFGKGNIKGAFHMWLPAKELISDNTYFIKSDAFTTITSPGNCYIPITLTAYNSDTDVLYTSSGRGYSTANVITPSLAAPGVNLVCPALNHGFTTMTGTSAAAAHAAGICAMLLEWCVVENNYPEIDTGGLKKFLIRGARRRSFLNYPNPDWGYGIIDVYNTFNILRTDIK